MIDEALYAKDEVTLKFNYFAGALSWATRNIVFLEVFQKRSDLAYALNNEVHESNDEFVVVPIKTIKIRRGSYVMI